MNIKVSPGQVILQPIPSENEIDGIIVEGSNQRPPNKAEVVWVGEADSWGKPIWKVGDTVITPSLGVINFEFDGDLYKSVHHMRIPFGYSQEPF